MSDFPKMLYSDPGGPAESWVIVKDAAEERKQRKGGFRLYFEPDPKAKVAEAEVSFIPAEPPIDPPVDPPVEA